MKKILVPLMLLTSLAACKGDGTGPQPVATSLDVVSGNGQDGTAGGPLGDELVVRVRDQNGQPMAQQTVTWAVVTGGGSVTPASSTTDAQGLARTRWTLGTAAGENTARATLQSLTPAAFTARGLAGPAARVTINPGTVSLGALQDTLRLSAAVADQHGNAIAGAQVSWTSADDAVASVDGQGLVRAQANGSVKVRAGAGGIIGESTVQVAQVPASVAVTPAEAEIDEGAEQQLAAQVRDRNGHAIAQAPIEWSSSAGSIAEVSASGRVSARAEGQATISARSGNALGQATIRVRPRDWGVIRETITAGDHHSCGITAAGQAYCWGLNNHGQLGSVTAQTTSLVPVLVTGGHTFQQLSAANLHTCGISTSGAAYCWGWNALGQLGNGSTADHSITPVAVSGGHTFQQLSAGGEHTCGITTSGAAYCWGNNGSGQLGNGNTTRSAVPVAVLGGHVFQQVGAGGNHTCGITSSGAAYCWGLNSNGELGNGTTTSSSTPVAVSGGHSYRHMDTGYQHSCGITTSGAAYCWGTNANGQLGNGTTTASSSPVAVQGGHSFRYLSAGDYANCALTSSGAAYCWGNNQGGHLGTGNFSEPITTPLPVTGNLVFRVIDVGQVHTCGVTAAGATYCWGGNTDGRLGTGSTGSTIAPAAVVGGLTFR